MQGSISPRSNKLLGQLDERVYRRVRSCLEFCEFDPGDTLVQEGRQTRYLHFPVSGVIARTIVDQNGDSAHFGICGNEGAIGLSGLSGTDPTEALGTSLVVVKTTAYRCPAAVIDRELEAPELRWLVIRYFRYVLSESMMTTFCNKHHTLHQQFCRLLLMLSDRTTSDDIRTTHELVAQLLGSRREGITEAVGRLRKEKVVTHSRGILRIADRNALLQRTCECYFRLHNRYSSLVGSNARERSDSASGR
jgi:CRP-like cAMP-binding protein